MPRSNIARKAQRKQQTRLKFESVSGTSSIRTSPLKVKKCSPLSSPVFASSGYHKHELNPDSDDAQISTCDPKKDDMNSSFMSCKPRQAKPRISLLGGKPKEQANERDTFLSQTIPFTSVFRAIRRDNLRKSKIIRDSSEGSAAESDSLSSEHRLEKLNEVGLRYQEFAYEIRDVLDLSGAGIIKHDKTIGPVKARATINANSRKPYVIIPSFKKNQPHLGTKKNSVISSSSEDDLFFISPGVSKTLPNQLSLSSLKRRRVMVLESTDDEDSPQKDSKISFSVRCTEDTEDSEDIISHARRNRTKRVNEGKANMKERGRGLFQKHYTRQQRNRKHRSEKEKAFELMKRRRAGENIETLTGSESTGSENLDDELEVLSTFEDDDEIVNQENSYDRKDREEKEDSESDFVVNDDEGNLGIPSYMTSVPLKFTHAAHKPLKEHFRDTVEWMVKNKVHPAFARDDEIYIQAFKKLDDVCLGLAKSKFTSTQWTQDFTSAIWTLPYFVSGPLLKGEGYDSSTGIPKCDACNHKKHIPTSFIQLEGQAYNRKTLVKTEVHPKFSRETSRARKQNTEIKTNRWFVGSLIHWKFALNEWVISALSHEGHLDSEKIAERKAMRPIQVDDHANQLIDDWENRGIIKSLYRDWKTQRTIAEDLTENVRS